MANKYTDLVDDLATEAANINNLETNVLISASSINNFAIPELIYKRLASCRITFNDASTRATYDSGVFLPTGAIVTGIRVMAPTSTASVVTNMDATVQCYVGSVPISNTHEVSTTFPAAYGVLTSLPVDPVDGKFVSTGGNFQIRWSATANAATVHYAYYIDYIYVYDV